MAKKHVDPLKAKQQKQKDKAARRLTAKAERVPRASGGEDPDIAGIQLGPQAKPWNEDDLVEGEGEAEEGE